MTVKANAGNAFPVSIQPLAPDLNRQAERSKQALTAAFVELLRQQNYQSITIQDIVGCANIGRSTFYRHFQSKARTVSPKTLPVQLADGREFTPRLLALDAEHDLAVLQIEVQGLPTIDIGDSQQLKPGQVVLAFGFPWGCYRRRNFWRRDRGWRPDRGSTQPI